MNKTTMRLDKFLADHSAYSRSQIKQVLRKKRVTVNGDVITVPETKVNPSEDQICLDGESLTYTEFVYYMLHKPAGVVSATTDAHDETVLSLLPPHLRKDIFPVGRLDKDTEGLLLLTNDGALAHDLLSPKKHVDKTYFATLDHPATAEDMVAFRGGLDIGEDKLTLPAHLKLLPGNDCEVTIHEGKFHQIKRMFHACGNEVVYLKRLRMGTLTLDESLAKGAYRPLTDEEICQLRESTAPGAKHLPVKTLLENKTAALFDMDGTLIDSMWVWPMIDVEFLQNMNVPMDTSLASDIEGMSFYQTAVYFKEHYRLPLTLEEIMHTWNQMAYEKYRHEITLKPGAETFLKHLLDNGYKLAIATSNSRELVEAVMENIPILKQFDAVVTSDEVSKGKPAPDVYLEAARRIGAEPDQCIVFEDVYNGIMAGKNAGMATCAVWDDFSNEQTAIKKETATYFLHSYEDLRY